MNLEKLKNQLQREIKRNPQKAGALGLLFVVALWFWAPLVWGWVGGGGKKTSPKPSTVATATTAPSEAEKTTVSTAKLPEWSQLADWMRSDPLMAPATSLPQRRNPFVLEEEFSEAEAAAKQKARAEAAEVTPEEAGLVLTSTIVGPERRVAMISGRAYLEGKLIVLEFDGAPRVFEVMEVHRKHIVLRSATQRYELKLAQASGS